jgi:cell division protein FtsB
MSRKHQVRWEFLILFGVLLITLTVWGLVRNHQELAELQSKELTLKYAYSQREMDRINLQQKIKDIDSNTYIVNRARSEFGYIMDGETRFEIENPELLDNYTADEWQVILDDLQLQN